ncbi:MAG TPA: SDR family NAD(P)-dependent oxidoreductase, partial [Arenibacter sp.]|nr:SDR family NAD(P)-dependent oxidoreductase [Arenibacter sp.]
MDLKDKIAYITGGSKGIGYGVAEVLLRAGMKVAISGRNLEGVAQAAKSLGAENNVLAIASNVTKLEDERHAVQQIITKWGALDVVVANAGVGHFAPIDQISDEHWHQMIDTNLNGVFHTLKASVEALKRSKGYYITLASLAGTNFF